MHHDRQELINLARAQASSAEARRDRARRRHLMEGSFAQASRHHFKRSRWRRLWRQQIQDHIIAAIQKIKLLINTVPNGPKTPAQSAVAGILALLVAALKRLWQSAPPNALLCSNRQFNFQN